MRGIALALLAAAITGLVVSEYFGGEGGWGWLKAFCEAAAVGALADWFAVVALFRHPLGLPIPHTAILPAKKDEIGDHLAAFVQSRFLEPGAITAKLAEFNPAGRLAEWLSDERRTGALVGQGQHLGLGLLEQMDASRLESLMTEAAQITLRQIDMSRMGGQWLGLLTRGRRHQHLLDLLLGWLAERLDDEAIKDKIFQIIVAAIEKESKWARVANRVGLVDLLSGIATDRLPLIIGRLQEIMRDPQHHYRQALETQLQVYVERLQNNPETRAWINERIIRFIESPEFRSFIGAVSQDTKIWLRIDLEQEDSQLGRWALRAIHGFAQRLEQDISLRDEINTLVLTLVRGLAPAMGAFLTTHIAHTVHAWDERRLVEELELSIGCDLQYIRFNGTLVGGIVGLLLHVLVVFGVPLLG